MKNYYFNLFVVFAFGDVNRTIINNINEKINTLNTVISASIWNIRYENFIKYQDINDELIILNLNLKRLPIFTNKKNLNAR